MSYRYRLFTKSVMLLLTFIKPTSTAVWKLLSHNFNLCLGVSFKMRSSFKQKQQNENSQSLSKCTVSKSFHNIGLVGLECGSLGQILRKLVDENVIWHLKGCIIQGNGHARGHLRHTRQACKTACVTCCRILGEIVS